METFNLKIYAKSESGTKYGAEIETVRGLTLDQKMTLESALTREQVPHQFISNH